MAINALSLFIIGLPLGLLTLTACNGDKGDDGLTDGGATDGGSTDGGSDGGTGDGGEPCGITILSTEPADGETSWYWRDPLQVTLDGATDDLSFSLVSGSGVEVPLTLTTSEGGLVHTLTPGSGMTGSETYTLNMDVCGNVDAIGFSTTAYGTSLNVEASSLIGHTWYFDLPGATFVQPIGIGALLSTFLTMPILVGVTDANSEMIDLLGAQGVRDESEAWVQDLAQVTWDFPAASFEESPYFHVIADEVIIGYQYGSTLYEIPVYGFEVEGTISADGSTIGGAKAFGQGDTRNMGPLIGAGDEPTALCETFASIGLVCEECPDGIQSCMTLEVLFPEAPLLSGVTLVEVE